MTREEAINYNENLKMYMKITDKQNPYKFLEENYIALDMAIEALKEPNIIYCKDCAYYRTPERYSYKDPNPYCCRSALTKVSENDFCSKAIMKEGD